MNGENVSELMVAIEELVGEKLDWKQANDEIIIGRKELTLICDTISKQFYELRELRQMGLER